MHKYATNAHAENVLFHREQSKDCMFTFQVWYIESHYFEHTTKSIQPSGSTAQYKRAGARAEPAKKEKKKKQNWQMHTQRTAHNKKAQTTGCFPFGVEWIAAERQRRVVKQHV